MSETEQIQEEEIQEQEQEQQQQEEPKNLTKENKELIEKTKNMNYAEIRDLFTYQETSTNQFLFYTKEILIRIMEEKLEKEGYPLKEILEKVINDITPNGLTSEDYIRRVTPSKYKNPRRVAAGKRIMEEKKSKVLEQIPDIEEQDPETPEIYQGNEIDLSPSISYTPKYVQDLEEKIETLKRELEDYKKKVRIIKIDKMKLAQLETASKKCKKEVILHIDNTGNIVLVEADLHRG